MLKKKGLFLMFSVDWKEKWVPAFVHYSRASKKGLELLYWKIMLKDPVLDHMIRMRCTENTWVHIVFTVAHRWQVACPTRLQFQQNSLLGSVSSHLVNSSYIAFSSGVETQEWLKLHRKEWTDNHCPRR